MAIANAITVNRAPVLTLWGAVVAEQLGFTWDEALTLGRGVAGLNAQSKGVHLGIFEPTPEAERARRRKAEPGEALHVDLMHRAVPAVETPQGLRAVSGGRPISPESVDRYLHGKFGENFDSVRRAMTDLARSLPPPALAQRAYALYEEFRPDIPAGARGWGASGTLDLGLIEGLAHGQRGAAAPTATHR